MIRFTFTYLKPVALSLSIAVLLQCCVRAYYKNPVTVGQAINVNHKKVKHIRIKTLDYKKIIFDSIYKKDHNLYGLLKKPKRILKDSTLIYTLIEKDRIELRIDEDKIIKIQLQNKTKSIILTLVIIGMLGYFIIGSFDAVMTMIFGS